MGYSRFWLKMADVESKSIPHELPSSHWSKATGQCVLERYLSATMLRSVNHLYIRNFDTCDVMCGTEVLYSIIWDSDLI